MRFWTYCIALWDIVLIEILHKVDLRFQPCLKAFPTVVWIVHCIFKQMHSYWLCKVTAVFTY